jgi:hypothetical protein
VDGRRVESDVGDGGKSVRVTLPVGRHKVAVRKDRFQPVTREVVVEAGPDQRIPVELQPSEPAVAAAPPPDAHPPAPPEPGPQPAEEPRPPKPEPVPPAEPPSQPKEEPKPPAPPPEPAAPSPPEPSPGPQKGAAPRPQEKPKAPTPEDLEEAADRQVKEVKKLIDDAKLDRLNGELDRAEKRFSKAGDRLREITTKYPGTKGAAEAQELIDKNAL